MSDSGSVFALLVSSRVRMEIEELQGVLDRSFVFILHAHSRSRPVARLREVPIIRTILFRAVEDSVFEGLS